MKKLIKDQTGSILTTELLIIIAGVVVVVGIVLKSVTGPLKVLHEKTAENITKVSRGF